MNNPLLKTFKTDFESTPFSKIKLNILYSPKKTIKSAINEVNLISSQNELPSFSNTIEKLENCGFLVGRNTSLLYNLNSADTNEYLQRVAQRPHHY